MKNRRGTLWFLREMAKARYSELPDTDGKYLFPNGGLILIDDLKEEARFSYAVLQLNRRLSKKLKILGDLHRDYVKNRPKTYFHHLWWRESGFKYFGHLNKVVRQIKAKLELMSQSPLLIK